GLAEEVRQALTLDAEVSIDNLRVDVIDGRVRLGGVAGTLRAVHRAEELVASCPGVVALDNALSVEDAHGSSDAELQDQASAALAGVTMPVSLQVSNGIAILRGEVESPSVLDAAVAAIERVPGIKGIRSDVT